MGKALIVFIILIALFVFLYLKVPDFKDRVDSVKDLFGDAGVNGVVYYGRPKMDFDCTKDSDCIYAVGCTESCLCDLNRGECFDTV